MIKSFDTWISTYKKLGIKPGLKTVKRLLELLGNPQNKIKVIHITGTNGKGTTATLFHNILKEAGYKTGLFMSPYLKNPEELCVINGQEVSTLRWLELADKVESKIQIMEALNEELPTAYEIYAAMMYLYFMEEAVDFAVVEVAMGGRNDCTNVMETPVLTVITAIDLDHQNFLGDTLLKIATEKSGIVKDDCPLILHPQTSELMAYFNELTDAKNVEMITIEVNNTLNYVANKMCFEYNSKNIMTSLLGKHQKQNIIGVIEGIDMLKKNEGLNVADDVLIKAIKNTSIPCRFEIIEDWVFDGAHNNASLMALQTTLDDLSLNHLTGIVGVLGDKDNLEGFKALKPFFNQMIVVEPLNERKCSKDLLKQRLEKLGYLNVVTASTLEEAYELAKKTKFMKMAFGSFYMVGPLRDIVKEKLGLSKVGLIND